jgi:putative flippase GtrA
MADTTSPAGSSRAPGRRSFRAVITRYTIGSVLAGVVSETALLASYGTGVLGPRAASVAGWLAGALLNYGLNRWWAWGQRGRANVWRELVPYWAITLSSLVISAWVTGLADRTGSRLFTTGSLRLAFVGAAFLAVYGVMFIAKFVLYHYFVFGGPSDGPAPASSVAGSEDEDAGSVDRRSRHQVPITTRE